MNGVKRACNSIYRLFLCNFIGNWNRSGNFWTGFYRRIVGFGGVDFYYFGSVTIGLESDFVNEYLLTHSQNFHLTHIHCLIFCQT